MPEIPETLLPDDIKVASTAIARAHQVAWGDEVQRKPIFHKAPEAAISPSNLDLLADVDTLELDELAELPCAKTPISLLPPPKRRMSGDRRSSDVSTLRYSADSDRPSSGRTRPSMFSFRQRGSVATDASAVKDKTAKKRATRIRLRIKRICSVIVDHKLFVGFGFLVTIWALVGDDTRLLSTNKPADNVFDALVLFCFFFFGTEVVLSCIGKNDYFLGFFFYLDVISTLTLLMDLTAVAQLLFGGGQVGKARSSRTARIGAKMGRVVRVLRLIRIVKLYKAFTSSQNKKKEAGKNGLDLDDEEEEEEEQDSANLKESLVAKKLSAKTTQRTIILVLSMLLMLPILKVDPGDRVPGSAAYAADDVQEAYQRFEGGILNRSQYEQVVLRSLYYHNWFSPSLGCADPNAGCPDVFTSHAFWVGIAGDGSNDDFIQAKALNASLSESQVSLWDSMTQQQHDVFNYGTMPQTALQILKSPWSLYCRHDGVSHYGVSVLRNAIDGIIDYAVECPGDLRFSEIDRFSPRLISGDQYNSWYFVFYFDQRLFVKAEAQMSLATTGFVCLVLCVASIFFASDADVLVLKPVEQMIERVEVIRKNPLAAMKMADDEFKREEFRKRKDANQSRFRKILNIVLCQAGRKDNMMETAILEKTIIKLGSLLALGFGEAGANIVSQNMSGADSAGVNAMIEGSRVECIVGMARIRNFSVYTEVLQGKVMTFVNQIAEIVHGVVDECRGAVNKNNGDTFLIIWRTAGMTSTEVAKLAEMSILAFSTILGAVHRSPLLATYRTHPGLQQRLRRDCRVNLTFSLHCGWAIEGAVGSEFKIDASYISPNVSIARSVENETRTFGVSILVTQAVVELCGKAIRNGLRLIDKVVIEGSSRALELYCLDLDYNSIEVDDSRPLPISWNNQYRFKARQCLEAAKTELWTEDVSIVERIESRADFKVMRQRYTVEFFQTFNMGYQNYAQGEWQVARNLLLRTLTMLNQEDGPSAALLRFMETPYQFVAPSGWQGVHTLVHSSDHNS